MRQRGRGKWRCVSPAPVLPSRERKDASLLPPRRRGSRRSLARRLSRRSPGLPRTGPSSSGARRARRAAEGRARGGVGGARSPAGVGRTRGKGPAGPPLRRMAVGPRRSRARGRPGASPGTASDPPPPSSLSVSRALVAGPRCGARPPSSPARCPSPPAAAVSGRPSQGLRWLAARRTGPAGSPDARPTRPADPRPATRTRTRGGRGADARPACRGRPGAPQRAEPLGARGGRKGTDPHRLKTVQSNSRTGSSGQVSLCRLEFPSGTTDPSERPRER